MKTITMEQSSQDLDCYWLRYKGLVVTPFDIHKGLEVYKYEEATQWAKDNGYTHAKIEYVSPSRSPDPKSWNNPKRFKL